MVRVAEKDDPADDSPCGSDSRPHSVSCPYGNSLHRLGDAKKAQDDKDDRNCARNEAGKSLTEFQRNRETDLEESSE